MPSADSTAIRGAASTQGAALLSLLKIAGGVAGFSAVLFAHQMLMPTARAPSEIMPDIAATATAVTAQANRDTDDALATTPVGEEQQLQSSADKEDAASAGEQAPISELSDSDNAEADEAALSMINPAEDSEIPQATEPGAEPAPTVAEPSALLSDIAQPESPGNTTLPEQPVAEPDVVAERRQTPEATDTAESRVKPALQWSAVWRPFFSPTTAQGFADYIAESTGLTLRVQQSPVAGHYLVEVQHRTEAERIDADRRIVETTGYKPPGAIQ